jgi:hypothetical protein
MSEFLTLKKDLIGINSALQELLQRITDSSGLSENRYHDWIETCKEIHRQLDEHTVRTAVVGPIKSGKSTFVNSMFQGDYLKRGAGVVTSIVTRIRSADQLSAALFFKSWDDVNAEMDQALVLFPAIEWKTDNKYLDIRRRKDREGLQEAMKNLKTESLFTNDSRDVNSMLLMLYLNGYDRVQDIVSTETVTRRFEGDSFQNHRDFVGDDSLAVYLKDIQLEIDNPWIDRDVEIADCQGSDSPNPLHLAMIQDYLLRTHLLVYVISSRTGLRRADIKFLNMIRSMGILDSILFVINCDISEHETHDDLMVLVNKVCEELSLIKPNPEVYTISALYNLFEARKEQLNEKDKLRLQYWQKEKEIVDYLDEQTKNFGIAFQKKFTGERNELLIKNHLERTGLMAAGIHDAVTIQKDIIARDADSAREIIDKIIQHQQGMNEIQSMVKNTLEGASHRLKKELKDGTDTFFDSRSGSVISPILSFIKGYEVLYANFLEPLTQLGFSNTLYQVFQEFKRHLDEFVAETINPEIIRFVRSKEIYISEYFESTVKPYESLVEDAMRSYDTTMNSFGIRIGEPNRKIDIPNIRLIADIAGLYLPAAAATMHFTAKIKTEAVLRYGVYSIFRSIKKLMRRSLGDEKNEAVDALKDGVVRLKHQTENSVVSHFKDYRENLKFQYLFKLVDAVSKAVHKNVLDRFQSYMTDLSKMAELIRDKRGDKKSASSLLDDVAVASESLQTQIDTIRNKLKASL